MHLSVEMPSGPLNARGSMKLRVARKVAALCGVPGPPDESDDAGGGRSWFGDFQALTATELSLGGPLTSDPPPGVHDTGRFARVDRKFEVKDAHDVDFGQIPNVALRAFGPDTRAALVLTGVNLVLEPVTAAVVDAMDDIRTQVDSPNLLIAVAQCMLQEVFSAQPILVFDGIRAARTQRMALDVSRMITRAKPAGAEQRLARVEFGWPRPEYEYDPTNVEIISRLWSSLVTHDDVYDHLGQLRNQENRPYLRADPLSEYEQSDPVAVPGQDMLSERLVSLLRNASETAFVASTPGAPPCRVILSDGPDGEGRAEVVIPRQQQIEVMLANLAHRLGPLLPGAPSTLGRALRLPRIRPDRWVGADLLRRRAVLLAHYYSLRAAGWISGMLRMDRRRNRDECAERCAELIDAARRLLPEGDPLLDQITLFALGYRQQYLASFGRGQATYAALRSAMDRAIQRADTGELGRAELLEVIQVVLRELNSVRRAAFFRPAENPPMRELNTDLRRWWEVVHRLRRTLVEDERERTYLDHGYVTFLLSHGSTSHDILEGMERMREVLATREDYAQLAGRSLSVRMTKASYLRGLALALERRIDPNQMARWAAEAVRIADELERHEETRRFLDQRTTARPARPLAVGDEPVTYDGAALRLLITLADGWVSAVRSRFLDEMDRVTAEARAERAVVAMQQYVDRAREHEERAFERFGTQTVDPLRIDSAEDVARRWREWQEGRARRADTRTDADVSASTPTTC